MLFAHIKLHQVDVEKGGGNLKEEETYQVYQIPYYLDVVRSGIIYVQEIENISDIVAKSLKSLGENSFLGVS